MTRPIVDQIPEAAEPTDQRKIFDEKMYAHVKSLNPMISQINNLVTWLNDDFESASTSDDNTWTGFNSFDRLQVARVGALDPAYKFAVNGKSFLWGDAVFNGGSGVSNEGAKYKLYTAPDAVVIRSIDPTITTGATLDFRTYAGSIAGRISSSTNGGGQYIFNNSDLSGFAAVINKNSLITAGNSLSINNVNNTGSNPELTISQSSVQRGRVIWTSATAAQFLDGSNTVKISYDAASVTLHNNVTTLGTHTATSGFIGDGSQLTNISDSALPTTMTGGKKFKFNAGGQTLAVGRNSDNAGGDYQGLQIGGGDDTYGADGNVLASDGHASWTRLQPSKNESCVELLLYPTAAQGIASCTSGTGTITRISGSAFTSAWVGRKIYFGYAVYRVSAVADANNLTVVTLAGAAVSFPSSFSETYHVCYIKGQGFCNTNGITVTRVSGDPFVAFFNLASFTFNVNGVSATVISSSNTSSYTVSASLGTQTAVPYTFELDINDQLTTLRIQKLLGSNEENLSIYARYDGYYIHSQFAGSGKYRPIYLTAGEVSGQPAKQLSIRENGDLLLGGDYNSDALRILARGGAVANRLETQSSPAGFKANIRARGSDTNVGLALDAKGEGEFLFTNGSFARSMLKISCGASANSHLSIDCNNGFSAIKAEGSNADLIIGGSGTGVVAFNTMSVAASSAPAFAAQRHLQIKDASGTVYYIPLSTSTW